MLCPEQFQFPTPSYNIECMEASSWAQLKKSVKVKAEIESHKFVRMLSVVVPANERLLIDDIANDLESGSCSLYLVKQFSLAEMVRKEFLEAFVKHGKLYGISSGTRLETDDCAAISPDGMMIMSLNRETYECLKFCSNLTSHRRDKYVVMLDLKSSSVQKLAEHTTLAWNMILRWIAPVTTTCLSNTKGMAISSQSIERYLRDLRHLVVEKLPPAGCKIVQLDHMSVPVLDVQKKQGKKALCTPDELMEYIGLIVLNCNTKPCNYLSAYSLDGRLVGVDTTFLLHRQGMFTPDEIERTIERLVQFLDNERLSESSHAVPWVALHVQGFPNVPLNPSGTGECGVRCDHDRAYTVVISGQGKVLWRKMLGRSGRGSVGTGDRFV